MLHKVELTEDELKFLLTVLGNTEFKVKGAELTQYGRLMEGLVAKLTPKEAKNASKKQ